MTERKRCCCNCGHCIRKQEPTDDPFYMAINNYCDLDDHYISYLETFDGWCRHWKKDRAWEKLIEKIKKQPFELVKPKEVTIVKRSNIIQFDDMGYPLQLCIMSDGSQQWFDVNEEYADKGLEDGSLKVLEWKENGGSK